MTTKIVKVDSLNPENGYIQEAVDILRNGGLVIIPTETVYGIVANMLNKDTMDKLYKIKKRPKNKLFSLHIDEKWKVEEFACDISILAYKLMDKFWPGPLTLVLKSKNKSSAWHSRTIALRMPDNEIALRIIRQANVPLVCPSANISGKPAPTNFAQAIEEFQGLVDFAIDAGETKLKVESSVVDLTIEPLRILREGAIKREALEAAVRKKHILFVCTGNSCRSVMAKGLLEKKLREQGRQEVEVLSAGIMMLGGLGATPETQDLLKKESVDVSTHRSQRITRELIKKSDLILIMERLQEERILQLAPEVKNRLFLLKEFAKINSNGLDIADPIGKPMEFYEQTLGVIKVAIERIANII